MRKICFGFVLSVFCISVNAAMPPVGAESQTRRSAIEQYNQARATASRNQIAAMGANGGSSIKAEEPIASVTQNYGTAPGTPQPQPEPVIPNRDAERNACINNNIGVGNTFVWASRYSNTNSYASMVEDVQNPENNICFVRVEIKSSDPKINLSDIAPVYYQMGTGITCGAWTNEDTIEKRILDAKKSVRTWGTVAGVVGGAALGVGAMELFGNSWIGGAVEGQKGLAESDPAALLRSQLLVLKQENKADFDSFQRYLGALKAECDKLGKEHPAEVLPPECTRYNFETLMAL